VTNSGTGTTDQQFLFIEAVPSELAEQREPRPRLQSILIPETLSRMPETHRQRTASWQECLKQFDQGGTRVVAWGTGGKGITFLNSFDTRKRIPFVVDINPHRHNKFVPQSGQKTVSPDFLREYRPDVVVITNALYESEIRREIRALGIHCECLCI
jgi:hypothetical protein